MEPFERAIERMHGRRLLLRWLAKRAAGHRGVRPTALTVKSQKLICVNSYRTLLTP